MRRTEVDLRRRAALCGALGGLALGALPAGARPPLHPSRDLRFSGPLEPGDTRFDFPAALVALAAQRAGLVRRPVVLPGLPEPRLVSALRIGSMDVGILPHLEAERAALRTVRFPIRRGLLGVRLLLARPDTAERLMLVEDSEELKRGFVMGYGRAWADGAAFEALGFRLERGASYSGLFDMLRAGRFDYLSRGVNELRAERADPRLAGNGLVVVPGIALFYPLDDYFCVRTDDPELQAALERGLRAAMADGSYARLFTAYYGEAIRESAIEQRSVLHVLGYPVPPGTPLDQFDILQLTSSRGSLAAPRSPVG